jgi:uncharacterized protein (DUF2141 family)
MKVRSIILLVTTASALLAAPLAHAQPAPEAGIKLVVSGLRNDHGRVGCSLFNGPKGFPRHDEFRGMWTSITGGVAVCDFQHVPAGTYAATVLHDENRNGKMDFNLLGLPTKGYGFSNNAKATLSAPSFDAASFAYRGTGSLSVPIAIVYWKL